MSSLGEIITKNDDLMELIFNERLVGTKEGKNFKDIEFGGSSEKLRFYGSLDLTTDKSSVYWESIDGEDGTILSFSSAIFHESNDSSEANSKHYFRFRIRLNKRNINVLSQDYIAQDRLVVSKLEKIEIIDFRLNELRDLPAHIGNKLNHAPLFKCIDFFLIRDINDEFCLAHDKYKRCRLLEKTSWSNYLIFKQQKLTLPRQMLIYHFQQKKDKPTERYNAFAKFVRVQISFLTIILFITYLIVFGIWSSLIASFVIEYSKSESYSSTTGNRFLFYCILLILVCMPFLLAYKLLANVWSARSPFYKK